MPTLDFIASPEGVPPGAGYSQVVTGSGRVVAVSGQVAFDQTGKIVGAGDVVAQARQVFENLQRCLTAAGASFSDVVKLTYFFTDITTLGSVRAVRDDYINREAPPASTAVQVVALALPELLIEIEALAILPS